MVLEQDFEFRFFQKNQFILIRKKILSANIMDKTDTMFDKIKKSPDGLTHRGNLKN